MYEKKYNEVVKFHGHSCPGLAIGYQASMLAISNGFSKSPDEELIAIVENNSCSVDAIQYILSCTFGKGNLYFKDYGKQAFTIIKRNSGNAIRISLKSGIRDKRSRLEFFTFVMKSTPEKIFKFEKFKVKDSDIPQKAKIQNSVTCNICKEPVMETRIINIDSKNLCYQCYEKIKKGEK